MLIVVGKSDAVAHDGARIGRATLGDSCADLVINANSSVGDVDAPFEAQVSGEGAGGAHVAITGDEGAAEQRHGTLLEAANDDAAWEDAIAALTGAATTQQAKAPAGSGTAYRNRRLHQPLRPANRLRRRGLQAAPPSTRRIRPTMTTTRTCCPSRPGEPLENDGEPDVSSNDQPAEDFPTRRGRAGRGRPCPRSRRRDRGHRPVDRRLEIHRRADGGARLRVRKLVSARAGVRRQRRIGADHCEAYRDPRAARRHRAQDRAGHSPIRQAGLLPAGEQLPQQVLRRDAMGPLEAQQHGGIHRRTARWKREGSPPQGVRREPVLEPPLPGVRQIRLRHGRRPGQRDYAVLHRHEQEPVRRVRRARR